MMKSYKPMVRTGNDPEWYGSELCFFTEEEEKGYAEHLMDSWAAVVETSTRPSPNAVTHQWKNGGLTEVRCQCIHCRRPIEVLDAEVESCNCSE